MKRRDQKKEALRSGLTVAEMELMTLLEEVLERFAMLEVLAFANNFLISDRTQIPPAERERIFTAAQRAVEPESPVVAWRERLGRLKGELLDRKRDIRRERRREPQGRAPEAAAEEEA